jgi:uncharacterized protein involved in type VI secretion and phage assembly
VIDMGPFANTLSEKRPEARLYGVTVGVVTNNQDPDGLGRVKVKLPWLSDDVESHWARVVTPMAGNDRGLFFLPEVDDEVLVAFEHGSPEFPYVLGALWNGKDKAPESNDDGENNMRTIKSRSGHVVRLDDTDGSEKIEIADGSGANSVVISTADNTITITADADITIESGSGKLILSGNGIEIKSQAEVKVEAGANMDLEASGQLNIKGATVNIN